MATRKTDNLKLAVEEFNRATSLDPLFALAWVGVADSLAISTRWTDPGAEDVFRIIEDAVKNALTIDKGLGEAYASLAWIHDYYGRSDEVEIAYQKAIELSPNYASAYQWYSQYIGNSDPLRTQENIDLLQKAAKLDPRSYVIGLNLARNYGRRGLYTLAERQYRKLIENHPDSETAYIFSAGLYWAFMGQFDKGLALLNKASALNPELNFHLQKGGIYLNLGDLEAAQEMRDKLAGSGVDESMVGLADAEISFVKGNPTGTREIINWLLPKFHANSFRLVRLGVMAIAQGDIQLSREIFLAAEPRWLEPDQWPGLMGTDFWGNQTGCLVAWVFLNSGDQELGSALLEQTTAYVDNSMPLLTEHHDAFFPDTCYLIAGDTEKALLSIETQLAHNHLTNWYLVHQMPMYDLIRDEPRYQAVLAERERRISVQRENIEKMAAD
jgi:tetratricopeptide (TPR) repeat protein